MFGFVNNVLLCFAVVLINSQICLTEPLSPPPALMLYSPGDLEYTDILVKRVLDNLTLICELRGDTTPRVYVWNYVGNGTVNERPFTTEPSGASNSSQLQRLGLQISDSGHYMCSAPPFSVTKYVLVQPRGNKCARGAFACESRCVLANYVCDGWRDCLHAEDEAPSLCSARPCARSDKLNCSSGRCISEGACCRGGDPLCRQPDCCSEHPRYSRLESYVEMEYPPLFEDHHAPDENSFIQSTIYTVTACALIFMIAVVLLVSAICKMHMKRAALRSYAHAERATAHHYNVQYAQAARFPPCYEASRLLEQSREAAASPAQHAQESEAGSPCEECPDSAAQSPSAQGFGLARLSQIFSSRYRQVPTQCCDVEMTDVRSSSLTSSPTASPGRARPPLPDYRSPTYCDLAHLHLDNATDLNYMATPVEFFRRRALRRNTLERVIQHINQAQRPLTLQLGRFQLSIPRFGRRSSNEPRPDTPNVAEINIEDLDFVRVHSNETYTLNGRTIRLLGGNFENYPVLDDSVRPPPYTEAMRYKLYGPPPEYLSRERLNNVREVNNVNVDEEARNNVEMPPCYEDLASGVDDNANAVNVTEVIADNDNGNTIETLSSVIDNLPAIDSDVNANETLVEVND
ncbi:PREDICTED: uncharacterized protein LOC106101644 [Papilio polytes]|uniref:uncharacterized protein LOC106101644 n=1 Tax=Papilio polytes TaxID=76194 RepID=UPI000675BE05|nr:PREDICTED: uncharacterized protein LOC106101644 [Papilio polytes]